jgi:hypothetical protein
MKSKGSRIYPAAMLRFQEACIEECRRVTETLSPKEMKRISLSMAETLANPKGALPKPVVQLTPQRFFFRDLFFDYNELSDSYQLLVDFVSLTTTKLRKGSTVLPARLTRFWRESYLHEFYIFLCRIDQFIEHVRKFYASDQRVFRVSVFLRKSIKKHLSDLEDMRGSHVHKYSYHHVDSELNRLSLLEMLVVYGRSNALRPHYSRAIRNARAATRKSFQQSNLVAKDALKAVFGSFNRYLLDEAHRLIYPSSLPTKPIHRGRV